jgi:hypothetical protein
MATGSGDRPKAIQVEGGSVAAELHDPKPLALIEAIGGLAWQDVVLRDDSGGELYREGPYNGAQIGRRVKRVASAIQRQHLESFMRRQRIENSQLGPVSAPGGEQRFPTLKYLGAWFGTLGRRKGGRTP